MKRLALLIVLLALAAHLTGPRPRARAGDDARTAPTGRGLILHDALPCADGDCPLRTNAPEHWHPRANRRVPEPPVGVPGVPLVSANPPELVAAPEEPNWFQSDPAEVRPIGDLSGRETVRRALDHRAAGVGRGPLAAGASGPRLAAARRPALWAIPGRLLDRMIVDRHVEPEEHDYGERYTLYRAGYRVDFVPEHRARIVEEYNRQVVARRLVVLGGSLAFVLACLAAVSGYIRADEATRGYYTNRLRLAAAAAVGAAGMAIYRVLT